MRQIFPPISRHLAAAGTFQIHDTPDAGIQPGNIMRATGLDQHRETVIAQSFHDRQDIGLQQRFAASEFHQRHFVVIDSLIKRRRLPADFMENVSQRLLLPLRESISRVAIRTAQIARRQPYKNAWQPRKGAFPLQAQINFINNQRVRHAANLAGEGGLVNRESRRFRRVLNAGEREAARNPYANNKTKDFPRELTPRARHNILNQCFPATAGSYQRCEERFLRCDRRAARW